MAVEIHPSIYCHPGDFLRTEIIEAHGLNVTDAAAHLGVSQDALEALLGGSVALSGEMAIRFEKAFGVKADTLMRMQAAYDLAQARLREGEKEFRPGRGYTKADWDAVSDNPELTPEELAQAKPFAEALPELAASLKRRGPKS